MSRSWDKLRAVLLRLATTTNGDYLMLMRVKYLQRHGGQLRYRRRIPEHLREIVDKGPYWTRALDLNAGEEMKAVARVSAANRKYEMEMRLAEKELALLNDPARRDIEAERQAVAAEQWAREMRFIGYDQSGMLSDPGQDSDYGIWLETVLWAAESRLKLTRPVELEDLAPLDRLKIETVKAGGRIKQPVTLARAMKLHADERQGGTPGKAEVQALRRLEKWLDATEANPRYIEEGSLHLSEFSRADAMRFSREMWTVDGSSHATIKRTIGVFKAVWTLANDGERQEPLERPETP